MTPKVATYQWLCTNAPVEIEGTLLDGRPFYFRARYDLIELRVGNNPMDQRPALTQTTEGEYDASWLSETEALHHLATMVAAL